MILTSRPRQVSKQRLWRLLLALIALFTAIETVGCFGSASQSGQIQKGDSRVEVRTKLGEPDERQEFVMPDAPFFGPQEGLSSLLRPGTVVEEWLYGRDGEVLYVWFAEESGQPVENWLIDMFSEVKLEA